MKCKYCESEFTLNQKGSGGNNRIFCYKCIPTNSNRAVRNKQKYELLMKYSNKLKLSRGCDICNYDTCAKALEWHHPGQDKEGDPATLLHYGLDRYLDEVEKCVLLCANCHREEHEKMKLELKP